MEINHKPHLNRYKSHLRDIADENYLCARAAFRAGYANTFFTLGQQAIEKYLKVILLYDDQIIRNDSHNLNILLEKVMKIDYVQLFFEKCVKDFPSNDIKQLQENIVESFNGFEHGKYGIYSWNISMDNLIDLDKFVFLFRRFCRTPRLKLQNGETYIAITGSTKLNWRVPHVGFSGLVETVLKDEKGKYKQHYKDLIWKNLFYGKRAKKFIKDNKGKRWVNSPIYFFESSEQRKDYAEYIKLPKLVEKYFEK